MRKNTIIGIVVLGLVAIAWSWAYAEEDWSDKPLIDEEFKAIELEMKKSAEHCQKGKNTFKIIKCEKEVWKKYEREGKLRGTDEYCKKHYGNLGLDKLSDLKMKLTLQKRKARVSPSDIVPGEVTLDDLRSEIMWIDLKMMDILEKRKL